MAQSAAIAWQQKAAAQRTTVPWHIWACALAVTSASFGGVWDISWHESIGRDTFWTAPHLFIHFGGILAGAASAWLIFHTTFSRSPVERAGAVRIWGFYGPLGAFLCCWGGVAMVTSAPFDNWWHAAYGLDVKILSPPHVVRILGLVARSLRTGCQDPQPAACRADPRADGDSLWRGGLDPGGNAPGRRSLTPQTAGAAPLYVHVPAGRGHRRVPGIHVHRLHA